MLVAVHFVSTETVWLFTDQIYFRVQFSEAKVKMSMVHFNQHTFINSSDIKVRVKLSVPTMRAYGKVEV